jgi:rhodanese-related sulfurtransferase
MQSAIEMVATARGQVENLTPTAVAVELAGETDVVLVDVREPDEREEHGVITGALHVPRGMLEFCADPMSPAHRADLVPGRRVILYCASGGRSALATVVLRDMGYGDVAHLDGGLGAWKAAGLPVEGL